MPLPASSRVSESMITLHLSCEWASLATGNLIKLCMTVYKALHGITPAHMAELCRSVAATHYRSRRLSATCRVVPRTHLELGKGAFVVAVPTACNIVTLSVRLEMATTTFKTGLKTHLFSTLYVASKYQWLAYASVITICFCKACKAPLRCLHLRRFRNFNIALHYIALYCITLHYITLHYITIQLQSEN